MAPKRRIDASIIERLNGRNFRASKWHISFLLTNKKTLNTLTSPEPTKNLEDDSTKISCREKWEDDNAWVRALILHCISDDIIPLFEDYETAKDIMNAFEKKYGPRWDTYILLLLDKYNGTRMGENDSIRSVQAVIISNHQHQPQLP